MNLDTKRKIEKFNFDKLRENTGIFGVQKITGYFFSCIRSPCLQHRGQEGCGIVSFDGKNYHSEKRQGLVRSFHRLRDIKKATGKICYWA